MKTDPYCQQQECRPLTLVSGDIRFIRIFAEVLRGGASNDSGVVDNGNFQLFRGIYLEGHPRSLILAPIERAYATSYYDDQTDTHRDDG